MHFLDEGKFNDYHCFDASLTPCGMLAEYLIQSIMLGPEMFQGIWKLIFVVELGLYSYLFLVFYIRFPALFMYKKYQNH